MGGDLMQTLQSNAVLQLLQGNCWWRLSNRAAITVGLQCRQGNHGVIVLSCSAQESRDQGCSGLWVACDARTMIETSTGWFWLGKPCLEGFLGFLILLRQSVVETKCIQLMKFHSLWPNGCFILIKLSSCCRATGTRSFQSSRTALQVLPHKSYWPKRKHSQTEVLLERNS